MIKNLTEGLTSVVLRYCQMVLLSLDSIALMDQSQSLPHVLCCKSSNLLQQVCGILILDGQMSEKISMVDNLPVRLTNDSCMQKVLCKTNLDCLMNSGYSPLLYELSPFHHHLY